MGEEGLYMKAIELDKSNSQAYKNLSKTVGRFGRAKFPDGSWVDADRLWAMGAWMPAALPRDGIENAKSLERPCRFKGTLAIHN